MLHRWLFFGILLLTTLFAQTSLAEEKLVPVSPAGQPQFGTSVAASGSYAIIGAPNDSDYNDLGGSVHIFERVAGVWTYKTKLGNGLAVGGSGFGTAVGISGERAIVGAPNDFRGKAYVFVRVGGSWVLEDTLEGDAWSGEFGAAVSISGSTALVSAPNDSAGGTGSGAVYFYSRSGSTWSQDAKLVANDSYDYLHLGESVALFGLASYAVVGATRDGTSGAVYIFDRVGGTWQQQDKIAVANATSGAEFGASVAGMGFDTIAVGAPWDSEVEFRAGAAFIIRYDGSSWVQEAKLRSSSTSENDNFGSSVSMYSFRLVVGAPGDYMPQIGAGSVAMFSKSGSSWIEMGNRSGSDICDRGRFGTSVAITIDQVFSGANWIDSYDGAVYVYPLTEMGAIFVNGFECGNTSGWSP